MVSVVDAQAPKNKTAAKVSDLFKDVSGVEFGGGPVRSGESPQIRGYDADGILITLDGRRQNFEAQHSSKSFIDPSMLKRVEVVKGPSSASYGSGAIGGVIAFTTKDARDFLEPGQKSGAQVSVMGQTANNEFGESLTGYMANDEYDAIASIIRRDSGSINLNNGTKQRSDDGLISGIAKLTYGLTPDSSIKFDLSSFYNTATENANPSTNDPTQDNLVDKDIFSHQAGVTYKFNPDNIIDLTTRLYYVDTAIDETVVEPTGLTAVNDDLGRTMKTIGFNIDNRSTVAAIGDSDNIFAYGLELYKNSQDGKDSDSGANSGVPGGRAGVPDAESFIGGTYLQDEISFNLAKEIELLVTPGVRFDYYKNNPENNALPSDEETRLSPKFGTTLKLHNNYSLFANYAEAFRAPNLTELYAAGTHFSVDTPGPIPLLNNTFVANPYLQPETSRTVEFGGGLKFADLAQKDDELRVKASRYITQANDYIEGFVTGPNFGSGACPAFPFSAPGCNFGTSGFRNVPSAHIWGYELDTKYDNSAIEAGLNLSYVSAENARTGAFLATKQPLVVASNLGYKIESIDSTIGYMGKYVDGLDKALIDTSDPNFTLNYRRGGFATHGIYLSYEPKRYKNISLDLAVDNLFDKKYRVPGSEIYDYERNFKARFTYKW
jgi:hemoglobin/transferrin/lactoferrin receptor protein